MLGGSIMVINFIKLINSNNEYYNNLSYANGGSEYIIDGLEINSNLNIY